MTRARLLLVAAVLPAALEAQQPAFKSGVDLVRIPVSVTRDNTPVEPGVLSAQDFTLTEDGVSQSITLLERESVPVSVIVAFDVSRSMTYGTAPTRALAAMQEVVTRLLPEDEAAVVAFASQPSIAAPWSRPAELVGLKLTFQLDGLTSLNDAVMASFDLVDAARNPKPVILIISDGGENSSRTPLAEMVKTRRQSETLVYAFNVAPAGPQMLTSGTIARGVPKTLTTLQTADPAVMSRLAGDSGGAVHRVLTNRDAVNAARAFVDDLRFQYTIGYTPAKPLDGKYRRVQVAINKRGYRVRHRGGYLAVPAG